MEFISGIFDDNKKINNLSINNTKLKVVKYKPILNNDHLIITNMQYDVEKSNKKN